MMGILELLEAAIGIEPMNKGFAVLAKLFAEDRLSVHRCIFINLLAILVCQRSPEFFHVEIGSDPRVTQERELPPLPAKGFNTVAILDHIRS